MQLLLGGLPRCGRTLTFALVNLEDHANVGVVQGRRRLCFALEAGKSLRILGYFIEQEFQGGEAMQLHILGFVNDPHPAAAKFFNHAVMRDGLTDQLGGCAHLRKC